MQRQSLLYAEEFGYSNVFASYVAAGMAPFVANFNAARDALWIAENEANQRVGAIAIVHDERPDWAKLRWFFLEGKARGTGLGRRLMDTALAFAKNAGYAGVLLWTVDDLVAARRLYEAAGFVLAYQDEKPCQWALWGHEQRWEKRLQDVQ